MERIYITGANRGIGLEIVRQYMEDTDAQVIATCRNPDKADELQALQRDGRLAVLRLDLDDDADIAGAAEALNGVVDGIDVLIHNAGMNPPIDTARRFGSLDRATVAGIITTNAVAPLLLTQALIGLVRKGNNPRIVMVSSQTGSMWWTSSGGSYAYRMSKAAMNMAARTLSKELSDVICITLHPGWVQTDMGGPNASIMPEESASGIRALIARLTPADDGGYFKWNGEIHPW